MVMQFRDVSGCWGAKSMPEPLMLMVFAQAHQLVLALEFPIQQFHRTWITKSRRAVRLNVHHSRASIHPQIACLFVACLFFHFRPAAQRGA